MVKEVRMGWDEEFGQPPLDVPPHWDNDEDDLAHDLKHPKPQPRRAARPSTRHSASTSPLPPTE